MSNICSKAKRKLSDLTRVAKFLRFKKRRILFKAFIESQFEYCPSIWMFHGRQIKLHERSLRIVPSIMILLRHLKNCWLKIKLLHHNTSSKYSIIGHRNVYKAVNNLLGTNFNEFFIKYNHNYNL